MAKKQGSVKLGLLSWGCQGQRCVAKSVSPVPNITDCKVLAEQVGYIKSYGHVQRKLSETELQQCNAGIAVASNTPPKAIAPQVGQGRSEERRVGKECRL